MDWITILLIAVSLSMDAVAVALSYGVTKSSITFSEATIIAFWFGGFQALMPLAGWLVGFNLRAFIVSVDHWIAFILLAGIGARMIYESVSGKKKDKGVRSLKTGTLFLLSVATSIDAFVVGISLALIDVRIITPIIIIGSVTFVLSHIGVFIGKNAGRFFVRKAEIVGGLVLIGIGAKILLEHLGIIS